MVVTEAVLDEPPRGLICDADPITTGAISRELCSWGCQVEVAGDGLTALEIALRLRPTFVVVSLNLPILSGWDVARTLSRVSLFGGPRLIAMSGREIDVHRAALGRVGFKHHLGKPVSPSALRLLLDNTPSSQTVE